MSLKKLSESQACIIPAALEQKPPTKIVTSLFPYLKTYHMEFSGEPVKMFLNSAIAYVNEEEHLAFEGQPTKLELRFFGEKEVKEVEYLEFLGEPIKALLAQVVAETNASPEYVEFSGEPTKLQLKLSVIEYWHPQEDFLVFDGEPLTMKLQEKK
jgi:hypothetical protein